MYVVTKPKLLEVAALVAPVLTMSFTAGTTAVEYAGPDEGTDGMGGDERPAPLGLFQFTVLRAVRRLGDKAFPAEIARHLSKETGKHVTLAQVFVALERLEGRHLVSSHETKPDQPARGGRRRRVFRLEEPGARAMNNAAAALSGSSGHHPEGLPNDSEQEHPALA